MKRTSFNDDWRVRPKVSNFLELIGGGAEPWEEVTLPHDATIGGRRDADEHWGNGFFPGGVWQYEKTLVAVLQGFGSGNPCAEETFGSDTHDTFHGRALAVVRPTGAGSITVTVSAKDCDDRTVTIESVELVEAATP